MKNKFPIILLFIGSFIAFTACNNKDNPDQPSMVTAYTPGQQIVKTFMVDNDTVVKMIDEATDLGTTAKPVIFLLHKQTVTLDAGYENIFYPVYGDRLAAFMVLWANEYGLYFTTADEKAYAYKHFLDFLVLNHLDAGLLVELIMQQGGALAPVLDMIEQAGKLKVQSANGAVPANDLLYRMVTEHMTPEALLNEYRPVKGITEGGGTIISVFKSVIELVEVWVEFANDNKPTVDAADNYMSFLNSQDSVVANYSAGTAFMSKTYKLSYDAGIWQAKINYDVEGAYAATHPTIAGSYIPACNTISTYLSCKGPAFTVLAKTGYSPAINVGTFDQPAAEMNGKVSVEYGDCCCFHYFSYLNFKINANTGYTEVSFSEH
jgi:hypothetical protein